MIPPVVSLVKGLEVKVKHAFIKHLRQRTCDLQHTQNNYYVVASVERIQTNNGSLV